MSKRRILFSSLLALGVLLLAGSAGLLVWSGLNRSGAKRDAAEKVEAFRMQVPQRREAVLDPEQGGDMPALQIGGTDIIGLLEIPGSGEENAVCGIRDDGLTRTLLCRRSGSLYRGDLVLEADSSWGLFSFTERITVGDEVRFTTPEGQSYRMAVKNVRHVRKPGPEDLKGFPLILLLRSTRTADYVVVYCE